MIENVVLPSLTAELITSTELFLEQLSPVLWNYSIVRRGVRAVTANMLPVSSERLKDWYEVVWSEGWI